ncbi:MAG: DUF5320 family protein [Clostridia bacterium]|jgi:hypothetical protein|nr:DUF5320 family protein [Clostridia bacterium]MBT7121510.1 DUF5320 family protein [Clostridia bacterium]
MPRMDGTGPSGCGSMTGGGFGNCNEVASTSQKCGRGPGGRGRRGTGRNTARFGFSAKSVSSQYGDTAVGELTASKGALEKELSQAREENDRLIKENEKMRGSKGKGSKGK